MRNQAFSQWQLIDSAADRREDAWNLDRQAGLRAWLTGGVVLLGICVISVRLWALQTIHQPAFLANANPLTQRSEDVPAMDGRIYSSDGQVLAYDHQRFAVSVHYRWLQDPPDSRWLRQQARSRLSRSRWSNEEAMNQARQEVLDEQAALWNRLAKISGQTPESLQIRRQGIQKRVERIAESVRKRQLEREEQQTEHRQVSPPASNRWERLWQFVVEELTQPPERESRDPIIVREELDYHEVIPEVSVKIVSHLESYPRDFPGVQIQARTQRIYPHHDLAACDWQSNSDS